MSAHADKPDEGQPATPKSYDHPTGGWGSLEGMAKVELEGKAGPSALQTLAE